MHPPRIDIDYDFSVDSNGGDPDAKSPTLRRYHHILWRKTLPNGKMLLLDEKLRHSSEMGSFSFASDRVMATLAGWKRYQHIIQAIPQAEMDEFEHMVHTIGNRIIFPSNRINNKPTINGARGMNAHIMDRFDLTLECIRRYYNGEANPLYEVFSRYDSFFSLFVDFKGYVDFFMLNDLVASDYSKVLYLYPFNDFQKPLLPTNTDEYQRYKAKTLSFIRSRNLLIKKWTDQNTTNHLV